MKERLYDVIKWGLVILIAGFIFYIIYPKYHFIESTIRGNTITGKVEKYVQKSGKWKDLNYRKISKIEKLFGERTPSR